MHMYLSRETNKYLSFKNSTEQYKKNELIYHK